MASKGPIQRAHAAVATQRWDAACAAFAEADPGGSLTPDDLDAWGLAALLCGRDDESDTVRERAHHAHLEAGDLDGAARAAFWLGLTLLMRGEPARAHGWLGRLRSIYSPDEFAGSVWRGYDRMNEGMRALFERQPEEGRRLLAEALATGREHGDADLELLARNGHGQALLELGLMAEGMAELDETMVLATTGSANPQAVGQVYCAAILVSRGCLDLSRSAEWTEALSRWCDRQPGLVHYRGQCLVHRSEVLQLHGRWEDAARELDDVLGRLGVDPGRPDRALGMAHYQRGELHRVRGESRAAEQAYRDALEAGHDPQPGLALLRAAQGNPATAVLALRRALAESPAGFVRHRLLPAMVEVALADGDLETARGAATELAESAGRLDSRYLRATAALAEGALALTDGHPGAALASLRAALSDWSAVRAPYDVARCRVLIARACRQLGDTETADLEAQAARVAFADLGAAPELSLLDAESPGRRPAPAGLTPRELEVLRMLATGRSNRDIARELVLSERTVARHVANIFAKTRVGSRAAATAFAYDSHLM
ncbi:LuxR C-terminal-related transcriptional regulator [Nocardioides sp.]|uniref:helix-turn-helix transcriptional regulator n=1 Tax=Nocardioides sp. TaxID=35761 RepID=UPI0035275A3F